MERIVDRMHEGRLRVGMEHDVVYHRFGSREERRLIQFLAQLPASGVVERFKRRRIAEHDPLDNPGVLARFASFFFNQRATALMKIVTAHRRVEPDGKSLPADRSRRNEVVIHAAVSVDADQRCAARARLAGMDALQRSRIVCDSLSLGKRPPCSSSAEGQIVDRHIEAFGARGSGGDLVFRR